MGPLVGPLMRPLVRLQFPTTLGEFKRLKVLKGMKGLKGKDDTRYPK